MPTTTPRRRVRTISPYVQLFIPIAFILGLGCGYLIWGNVPSGSTAGGETIQRVNVSTDDDPAVGPPDAPITIIEFSDFQCPYCASWYTQVYEQLMAAYPNQIRFVYRDLPLPFHPEAVPAAEAANCAGEQGAYWQFHDALFGGLYSLERGGYEEIATDLGLNKAAFIACLDDHRYQAEVQADYADATSAGLTGTPSFVINGRVLVGAQPLSAFKQIIDEELAGKD
jgi:protein-disulfide isomerase